MTLAIIGLIKTNGNKKVLLREQKRHTDYSVSSTPLAVLSQGEGGRYLGVPLPHLDLARGIGTLGRGLGTLRYPAPPLGPGQGGRYLVGGGRYLGVPPLLVETLPGGGRYLGQGIGALAYPSLLSGPDRGVGTLAGGGVRYLGVPPPPWVWTDRHLWKQSLTVVLCTRSVTNYSCFRMRFAIHCIVSYESQKWICERF